MDFPILTVVTFTPLVGALVIAFAPAPLRPRRSGCATALVAWVVSLLLLVGFDPHSPRPFQFVEHVPTGSRSSGSSTSSASTACRSSSSS